MLKNSLLPVSTRYTQCTKYLRKHKVDLKQIIVLLLNHKAFIMPPPPFRERAYCFVNVCRSVGQFVSPSLDQMVSDYYLDNNLSQRFHISHADLSW